MASLNTLITDFMQYNYSIAPSARSLEIIANAGFKPSEDPAEQFSNLESVERRIIGSDQETWAAKVFALAFPYEHVLTLSDEKAIKWAYWLGTAEYNLGRRAAEQKIKGKLFNKALMHFFDARQKGDSGKENASHIGGCYFQLAQYQDAVSFLLESRQKGNDSKENAGFIGECYFQLGKFEEGIREYEGAIELAKKNRFKINWMIALDYALEDSFELLNRAKETVQSPVYAMLLQRFQKLYSNFIDFWKANDLNTKHYFRLMADGQGKAMDRIMNVIATAS